MLRSAIQPAGEDIEARPEIATPGLRARARKAVMTMTDEREGIEELTLVSAPD
jgi:hypothetical protein